MGVAAYNRGSSLVARQIDAERRPVEFEMMDDLNTLPKLPGAVAPWGETILANSHGGWWITCPITGFGYWYKTLREAVQSWQIDVVAYDATKNEWRAVPRKS